MVCENIGDVLYIKHIRQVFRGRNNFWSKNMTWIEAGGHYNWLMFRDGDAEFRKKLKAQSIATAIAMSLFPTYIFLGKGEIHFAIGLLLSVTFFCLVAVIAWVYFKFKSNSESFTYMIGLMEEKGIKKVSYEMRHSIYETLEYLVRYDTIASYSFDDIEWKSWKFVNLKLVSKKGETVEIGIPPSFFSKKSEDIRKLLDSKISEG